MNNIASQYHVYQFGWEWTAGCFHSVAVTHLVTLTYPHLDRHLGCFCILLVMKCNSKRVSALPACMCVHSMHVWGLRRSEEGVGSPGTGVTDGCEPPCGWMLKTERGPSVRAVTALDHGAISPDPLPTLKQILCAFWCGP